MEKEPTPWDYTLHGGPLDGATGRCLEIRAAIARPSTEDPKRIHIYYPAYTDGARRHVTYRFSHTGYEHAIAT